MTQENNEGQEQSMQRSHEELMATPTDAEALNNFLSEMLYGKVASKETNEKEQDTSSTPPFHFLSQMLDEDWRQVRDLLTIDFRVALLNVRCDPQLNQQNIKDLEMLGQFCQKKAELLQTAQSMLEESGSEVSADELQKLVGRMLNDGFEKDEVYSVLMTAGYTVEEIQAAYRSKKEI